MLLEFVTCIEYIFFLTCCWFLTLHWIRGIGCLEHTACRRDSLPPRTQVSLLTSSCNSNKNKHASMVQWNMWRGSTRISPLTLSWNSIGNQSDFALGCSPASVRESDRLFAHRPVRPTVCPLVRAQERNDLFHVGQIMIWLCFSVFDKDIWMCPSPSVCRIMAWIQHYTKAKTKAFVNRSIGIF